MQNWYAIETEANFRRHDWEREVAADTRAALAGAVRLLPSWLRQPRLTLPNLKPFVDAPRLSLVGTQPMRQTAECSC